MPQLDGPMFAVAKEEDLQRSEHQKVLEEMENLEHKYEYEQRRESAEFNSTMERQQSLEDTEHAERKESHTGHKGFVSAASEALHEVAEKTREFAHEVKEKFTGRVTDHDISKATNHLDELRGQLAQEQHELREIQRQALLAEQTLNLKDYENLKEREIKAKKAERATEIKIHEANDHLDHLLYEHRLHQLRQKCSEREHHHASSSTHPPTLTPPHSPKIFTMPVPMN